MMLDAKGIAVRTGHHCTQPLMQRFGLDGTVRVSFSAYNTKQEIDVLLEGLNKLVKL
jgi:cysteine desulfurase / selenocysteine lyase